jgi:hypothetical protein
VWGKEENSMKAIARDTYSSSDVLELRDINKPGIGDDEVLVRVHAAGVDRGFVLVDDQDAERSFIERFKAENLYELLGS